MCCFIDDINLYVASNLYSNQSILHFKKKLQQFTQLISACSFYYVGKTVSKETPFPKRGSY